MMDEELKKRLAADPDGLVTYEYIANHIGDIDDIMSDLVDNMIKVDHNGQFSVSAARYLHAIDAMKYAVSMNRLIAAAIEKDRERAYIGRLLPDIWGADYHEKVESLSASDDNFRRIYKRLFPTGI